MPKKSLLFFLIFAISLFTFAAHAQDITPPTTTVVQTPSSPDGDNGWYVTSVQFELTATDLESGVKEIHYRIDDGTWQTVSFSNTQNMAPNPSFETAGATSSGLASWEASVVDPDGTYSQDTTVYLPGYASSSAKMVVSGGNWHGINHQAAYVPVTPFDNMSASVWYNVTGTPGISYFKVFAVLNDDSTVQIGESDRITSLTNGWENLTLDFIVNNSQAKGVYLDIGHGGPGTINVDGVELNSSLQSTSTTVTISSDSATHKLEYYSVDNDGNIETYSCISPIKNCITFKLDRTPPGNWHDSGAFRGFFGPDHELYVYTNVEDATSGLSVFTDKYQYKVDAQATFGRYPNILSCNGTWEVGNWVILISPPFTPGVHSSYLLTPKTDFCNNNWKECKIVRFYAEDMAGNTATKDFCINGPWIQIAGEGTVRSNHNIDMLSESNADNTDGLIEISGTNIDFFTSSQDWEVTNAPVIEGYDFADFWNSTGEKTNLTTELVSESGLYVLGDDFEIENNSIPNDYATATFNQIVFVEGNLTISSDIELADTSTALFIVVGDVHIDKSVENLEVAIFADGMFETAYNATEGSAISTLNLRGLFAGDTFAFQRTLQGTNNEDTPSESFVYEPKYLVQLKEYFSSSSVIWNY